MMSDKNNEEKLRILRERLNQIQEKKESEKQSTVDNDKTTSSSIEKNQNEELLTKPIEPSKNTNTIKYLILSLGIILVIYLGYEYVDFDSLYENNEIINEIDNNINNEINDEIIDDENLVYYKSEFDGDYIIILNSFEDISKANRQADSLKIQGLNCEVLQLSGVSNSNKDIFQTFIQGADNLYGDGKGPIIEGYFEEEAVANQYLTALKEDSTVTTFENGTVTKLQ